jgi:small subunit ribosomal protein S2
MKDISLSDLLKSGAHFGHQTSRWNPKMKPFIFTVRNNIHIMDLEKTRGKLLDAMTFAKDIAAKGGSVLFVGTKRQSKEAVRNAAIASGMPYVITRWLGGTFTNFRTIQKSIKKMERYENLKATGEMEKNYTKKERLMMDRELTKMKTLFEGVKDMRKLPEAVMIFDVNHDEIALTEAQKSKVKVIAVVDTNGNPDGIDFPIPSNDDAIKAIEYIANAMADAINEGKKSFVPAQVPNATNAPKPAPKAEAAA